MIQGPDTAEEKKIFENDAECEYEGINSIDTISSDSLYSC